MEDSLSVDELQSLDQLVEVFLHPLLLKWLLSLLDVLVHVSLHELEDEGESLLGFVTKGGL